MTITLGPALFDDARLCASERIQLITFGGDGRQLLAVAHRGLCLFDVETRAVTSELAVAGLGYTDIPIVRRGELFVVASSGVITGVSIEDGALRERFRLEVQSEEDAYYFAAGLAGDAILFASSTRLDRFTPSGERTHSLPSPLEGPESRVVIDATGTRALWASQSEVVVVDIESGAELSRFAIELGYDATLAFDGDRILVARMHEWRPEVSIRSATSGEVLRALREPQLTGSIGKLAALGERVVAATQDQIVCWDADDRSWVTRFPRAQSLALHPSGEWLAVSRGQRITRLDLASGARLDPTLAPDEPVTRLASVPGAALVMDPFGLRVLRDGAARGGRHAWSIVRDGERVYVLDGTGTLSIVDARGLRPLGSLRVGPSCATSVDVRGDRVVYPDPNQREPVTLATRSGKVLGALATPDAVRALFLGDDGVVVATSAWREDGNHRELMALGLDGSERWRRPIEIDRFDLLGASPCGRAFVAREEERVHVLSASGDTLASIPMTPSYDAIPVAFTRDDAWIAGNDGVLYRVRLASGEHGEAMRFPSVPTALDLDPSGRGLVAFDCRSVLPIDLGLDLPLVSEARASFPSEAIRAARGEELVALLEQADWARFDAPSDLPALFEALERAENESGVGPAHRVAAARLRERGARLLHPYHHGASIVAYGLSPDGRWLATGSWVGHDYERGGQLQVWDAASARVVNVMDPIRGGAGWPDYGPCLQWSPDGLEIGLAYDTNGVGNFDPFGEGPLPRTEAYTTDGWSRPPAFAWSRSGALFAIASWGAASFIPVVLVETDAGRVGTAEARWLARTAPPGFGEFRDAPHRIRFNEDDTRLLAANRHGQAFAVDVASGALVYCVEHTGPIDFSACGAYFAHAGEQLSIHDARTGERLIGELLEAPAEAVRWGAGARLAAVAEGKWIVLEGTKVIARFEAPFFDDYRSIPDAERLVFSQDASLLAFFDGEAHVSVWRVGPQPSEVASWAVDPRAAGLLFGPDDALYAIGPGTCVAYDATSGDERLRFPLGDKTELIPDRDSPLVVDGEDLGERFATSPAFPVRAGDRYEWALAFENGVVVAPNEAASELERLLAFVVDRRYALPARWAITARYESVAEAGEAIPLPEEVRARLGSVDSDDEPLASSGEGTLADLTELLHARTKDLNAGWRWHVSEAMHEAALAHARRGEVEHAARFARLAVEPRFLVNALADTAALTARVFPDEARELLEEAEAAHATVDDYWRELLCANLAAAHAALGDRARADALFARAKESPSLANEVNPYESRAHVALAALRMGEEREANAVLGELATHSHFVDRFLAAALREGHADYALELVKRLGSAGDALSWMAADVWLEPLLAAEKHDALLAWLAEREAMTNASYYRERTLADLAKHDHARVDAWRLERARASEHPSEIAQLMRELSKTAPQETIAELLGRLVERMQPLHRSAVSSLASDLAEALTRVGAGSSLASLRAGLQTDAEHLALLAGILRGGDASAYDEARAIVDAIEAPCDRSRALAGLAAAMHASDAERGAALFDEACELASSLSGDERRFALSEITQQALAASAIESAYRAWRAQSKNMRAYEAQALVDALAKAGRVGALLALFRKMPSADDMNGLPQHVRQAIAKLPW